jgi:hypothetical protein
MSRIEGISRRRDVKALFKGIVGYEDFAQMA